jgi:hypothetical protein
MQQQSVTNHNQVAGVIEVPPSVWMKIITLQKLKYNGSSKAKTVFASIEKDYSELMDNLEEMLHGGVDGK